MQNIKSYFLTVLSAWKEMLTDRAFRIRLFLVPGIFIIYSAVTQHLGNYIEMRKGVQLSDKFLYFFPSIDFSTQIFLLLYTSLIATLLLHLHKPKVIFKVLEMHFAVAVVRQMCILLIALEPPAGIIVLRDLFLENTVYPHNTPMTKDLFFSGHVASIWIYFLCAEKKYLKGFLLTATIAMSFMILCMRVHYTYDVYGAILFTSLIYFVPIWIKQNILSREVLSR